MNFFQRFMYGRYGTDQLGFALIFLYLILYLLSRLLDSGLLSLLSLVCVIFAFYRMLSRRVDRRREENARFLEKARPIIRWYNVRKCRRNDKDHRYFKCPNCGQQLRVPRGKGKISITCRNCGASFEEKT